MHTDYQGHGSEIILLDDDEEGHLQEDLLGVGIQRKQGMEGGLCSGRSRACSRGLYCFVSVHLGALFSFLRGYH